MSFALTAYDSNSETVATGATTGITLVDGKAIAATIMLDRADETSDGGGVSDLGLADLSEVDLAPMPCSGPNDCPAGDVCQNNVCIPQCADGSKDGLETDVDCGGGACSPCVADKSCSGNSDCASRNCVSGICTLVSGPPGWIAGANMTTARRGHGAALGPDGRVYAIGGVDSTTLGTVEALDSAATTWMPVASLSGPRAMFGAVLGSDDEIYAIGGTNGSLIGPIEAYTASSDSWSSPGALPTSRTGLAIATALDGRIFAISGSNNTSSLAPISTVEAYTIATKAWTTAAPIPTPRYTPAAATGSDGRIYVFGGSDASLNPIATVEAYDPTTNTWSAVAPLTSSRTGVAAVTAPDGRIYVIGGYGATAMATVEAYSPKPNRWTTLPSLSFGRSLVAATVGADGRIYALGGYVFSTQATSYNTVEIYGPKCVLSASSGSSSSSLMVGGNNFAASANVAVHWAAPNGTVIGMGMTDGTGAVTPIVVKVPAVAQGSYRIFVLDDRSEYPVSQPFTVTP